jgi:hypothetical protein
MLQVMAAETQAGQAAGSNSNSQAPAGTAPDAPEAPCAECASSGEKILAVVAALFGAFVILMAVDMFTGGKLSGMVGVEREREE